MKHFEMAILLRATDAECFLKKTLGKMWPPYVTIIST